MSQENEVRKGLAGVVADYTAVSKVVPETNSLTYRGYPVQELAKNCTFEDVAYLLWEGELPTPEQIEQRSIEGKTLRELDPDLIKLIDVLPTTCHPMDVLRTVVSYLGTKDPEFFTTSEEHIQRIGLHLLAQLPTAVAYDIRRRKGLPFIEPCDKRSFVENFLYMVFGDEPDSPANNPEDIKAFEQSLILYAEHSFNASTFTSRVVTSTRSDAYSAITAAIGALKGPLHGGANEFVMHTMLEIDDPAKAADWVNNALDNKDLIMGFGHRVYKKGDSRVPTMEAAFKELASRKNGQKWVEMYDIMAKTMDERTGIKPNLDFPSGPAYHLLGFDVEFFTPLFVLARVTGWTAHIIEQYKNNSLIRPLSAYNGVPQRSIEVLVSK